MFNPLSFISKFIKSGNQKELDRIGKIISEINLLEEKFTNLANEAFPEITLELKEKIKNGEKLDNILPKAFALVREASKRIRNERHYDVQLIGGVVPMKIKLLKWGLVKVNLNNVLSAYLNALKEKGVHVVTVNDYLAKEIQEMGQIYNFVGLTSGFINNEQNDFERKKL